MGYEDFSWSDNTLAKCKKHNRYQRYDFWESKTINKLLLAIQQGYVPVGKYVRLMKTPKNKKQKDD